MIGSPAMLELLAEECTELAQAALKLARKYRGENPTPRTEAECQQSLEEEIADVMTCIDQMGEIVDMGTVKKVKEEKLDRWKKRMDRMD
jgi:NTP pyrophosphatase (non-canonical NTP hydrolase)